MKAMKAFVRMCYSESLVVVGADDTENENEKAAAAHFIYHALAS